jgi:hypothetical protein
MALTPAQQATVKADILAQGDLNTFQDGPDGSFAIALLYNAASSPAFIVWKTNVSIGDVGKKFNGTELAGLTTGNQTRLQTIAAFLAGGVNPSVIDNRAFFDDVFSGAGGTNTRANLLALWKRTATRFEKLLFASGTGSDASPAVLGYEGVVSYQDIDTARRS